MGSRPITGTVGSSTIAHSLGISKTTLYRLVREGRIPAWRVRRGKRYVYRFHKDTVIKTMQQEKKMEEKRTKQEEAPEVVPIEMLEPEEVELVPVDGAPLLEGATSPDAAVAHYNNYRRAALKVTFGSDWVDENGDGLLYLQGKGARRLAAVFCIRIYDVERERMKEMDSEGEYISVIHTGKANFRGRIIEDMGYADNRMPFLTKGGKIPSEDINIGDFYKKSRTDLDRRLITNILGLESMPISELPESMRKDVVRVTRTKGGQGGNTQDSNTREKVGVIWKGCMNMCGNDEKVASRLLIELSKFKGSDGKERKVENYDQLKKTSDGWVGSIYGSFMKEAERWKSNGSNQYVMADFEADEVAADEGGES